MSAYNGALGIAAQSGLVSPDYLVAKIQSDADGRFVAYWLRSHRGVFEMTGRLRGIGSPDAAQVRTPRVNAADLGSIVLATPDREGQARVAEYLDHETARIDTLIAKQEQLIANLRERQRAMLEHAVFHGLRPEQESKSDEEWLPATPVGWKVIQLGFVAETLPGWAFPSEWFTFNTTDVKLLRGVNIKPGRLEWSDVVYWDQLSSPIPAGFELKEGDLVLGMDRPFVGGGVRVAAVTADDLPALLLQRVLRIRAGANVDRNYLRHLMSTQAFLTYLEPLFTGVSVPHISEWQVRKFKIPLPPMKEQGEIADHIGQHTVEINTLIAKAERFIELSKERRAALITAAVTGQFDVRATAT
jgi:type I restriction enzyme S subunit